MLPVIEYGIRKTSKTSGKGMYNPTTNRLLMGAAGLLGLCVFAIDAFTPLDFAIAVVYVLVILLVALTGSIRATRVTAGVAMVLTVVAFAFSQNPDPDHGQLALRAALLAIGTTTLLALRNLADMARRRRTEAALARSEAFLAEAQRLTKTGSIALRLPSNDDVVGRSIPHPWLCTRRSAPFRHGAHACASGRPGRSAAHARPCSAACKRRTFATGC
jgi:hypothetical protein